MIQATPSFSIAPPAATQHEIKGNGKTAAMRWTQFKNTNGADLLTVTTRAASFSLMKQVLLLTTECCSFNVTPIVLPDGTWIYVDFPSQSLFCHMVTLLSLFAN